MSGKIESGNFVRVCPIKNDNEIQVGSIVLCKVNGAEYLHLVKEVRGNMYKIGNNRGKINGWTDRKNIFGKVAYVLN